MAAQNRAYLVRKSSLHGRGVFAARDIERGEQIIEYKGRRTTWDDAGRVQGDEADPNHTFIMGLDCGDVLDATTKGNSARYINHSCDPNCHAVEDDDERIFIYAKRKIKAGTELGYDYKLNYDGRITKAVQAQYKCLCGAKKCRGTMLDV